MHRAFYLLQAAGENTAPAAGGSIYTTLIMFGGILVLLYIFIVLPQRRQQKKQQKMLSELKEGDKVVTIGGILGSVKELPQEKKGFPSTLSKGVVVLQIEQGMLCVDKQSIAKVEMAGSASEDKGTT